MQLHIKKGRSPNLTYPFSHVKEKSGKAPAYHMCPCSLNENYLLDKEPPEFMIQAGEAP